MRAINILKHRHVSLIIGASHDTKPVLLKYKSKKHAIEACVLC